MVIRILFFLLITSSAISQNIRTFRVQFTDKNNSPYSISQPQDFLSSKAIQRRVNASIPIEENDLPINQNYIDSILKFSNVILKAKSKWLNTICIETDSATLLQINAVSFVQNSYLLKSNLLSTISDKFSSILPIRNFEVDVENYYGQAYTQIEMLNGHHLHNAGYRGEGMTIAVLDAGFPEMNTMDGFANLFSEGRVLGTYNFVDDRVDVYTNTHFHGTTVMSCMGAELPYQQVGTAPKANYYFFMTEDAGSEHLLEEDNWVEAAEKADSLGVDLINSSLGYTTFDDSTLNHTYNDMNGSITFISRGADIAASKGILVVNSAGNSGTSSWYYISAPADGDSVLAIGAVGPDRMYASFSSKGPSSDGDIKPNVAAQGFFSALIWPGGNLTLGSGTSFASPILCGMATCLWQAHPDKTNMEIFNAIQESASQYNSPDDFIGYGIPDFWKAHEILSGNTNTNYENSLIQVYPNPFVDELNLEVFTDGSTVATVHLIDEIGKLVFNKTIVLTPDVLNRITFSQSLNHLSTGIYVLKITIGNYTETVKISCIKP